MHMHPRCHCLRHTTSSPAPFCLVLALGACLGLNLTVQYALDRREPDFFTRPYGKREEGAGSYCCL